MSGGAYDYAYSKLEYFIVNVNSGGYNQRNILTPKRRAFLKHLVKVAEAMRAIEWNDSGDGADEDSAIDAVFNHSSIKEESLKVLIEDAKELINQLNQYTNEH